MEEWLVAASRSNGGSCVSMPVVPVFTGLLRSLEGTLEGHGFARAKRSFWTQSENNVGIIDVRKSSKSTTDRATFTMNVGMWSARIGRFVTGRLKSHPPGIDDCHWRERIGFLLPAREDRWWTIGESDDPATVAGQLSPIFNDVAVPAVIAHLQDEALRDEWLAGNSAGLTDVQRLMYLTILLQEIGPRDALRGVIAELKMKTQGRATDALVAPPPTDSEAE
jgi:hypothetical protein